MTEGKWVAVGSFAAAVAVGLGAFAAHALKAKLDAADLETFQVGVRYHLVHAIGLIIAGIMACRWKSPAATVSAALLLGGVFLFSGGIYIWTLTGLKAAVHVVPLGGVCFLLGWIVLGVAAWRR